jgi:hypothetical protein
MLRRLRERQKLDDQRDHAESQVRLIAGI